MLPPKPIFDPTDLRLDCLLRLWGWHHAPDHETYKAITLAEDIPAICSAIAQFKYEPQDDPQPTIAYRVCAKHFAITSKGFHPGQVIPLCDDDSCAYSD